MKRMWQEPISLDWKRQEPIKMKRMWQEPISLEWKRRSRLR